MYCLGIDEIQLDEFHVRLERCSNQSLLNKPYCTKHGLLYGQITIPQYEEVSLSHKTDESIIKKIEMDIDEIDSPLAKIGHIIQLYDIKCEDYEDTRLGKFLIDHVNVGYYSKHGSGLCIHNPSILTDQNPAINDSPYFVIYHGLNLNPEVIGETLPANIWLAFDILSGDRLLTRGTNILLHGHPITFYDGYINIAPELLDQYSPDLFAHTLISILPDQSFSF